MILDNWQKEILEYDGDILLCTGRQVGKTTTFAIKAVEYMIHHAGSTIIIASLTEDQAKLIIVMMVDYAEKHYRGLIAKGKDKPTQNKLMLTNKSVAIARPVGNTGDAIRGFTGDVLILDEVSRFSELVMDAASPTLLTTGGQIWLCSTPFGKQGYFYRCFKNENKRFKVWHISSEEVIYNRPVSAGWSENQKREAISFLESEKKEKSKLKYEQEYLGRFVDDLRQLFSDELIKRCQTLKRRDKISSGTYYLGVDVARMGEDESTFQIIQKLDREHYHQVENIVTKKTRLNETANLIIELNSRYKFRRIYIDDGGLGVGVFDFLLSNDSTRNRVVAINNRSRPLDRDRTRNKRILKNDLYNNLLMLMEQGRIKLLDDDDLFLSLKSVQYEYTIKENAVTEMKIFGDYTHIAEGLIRAAWCVEDKTLNIWCR